MDNFLPFLIELGSVTEDLGSLVSDADTRRLPMVVPFTYNDAYLEIGVQLEVG